MLKDTRSTPEYGVLFFRRFLPVKFTNTYTLAKKFVFTVTMRRCFISA
jgi:hypothetical protein